MSNKKTTETTAPASSDAKDSTSDSKPTENPENSDTQPADNDNAEPAQDDENAAETTTEDTETERTLILEPFIRQKPYWPREGNHILAQYDDDSVIVYQAFNNEIAEYAVENQQFGGSRFNFNRMSWIKTNFLWMMFRCGWATKEDQENVLAVRIKREGFDEILANAYTAKLQKSQEKTEVEVRLQWDPDHGPNGSCERRRAVQLGLRKSMLQRYASEFIISIENITEMVKENHHHATMGSIVKLNTPRERVYHVKDEEVRQRIALSKWEDLEEDENEW